VPAVPVLGPCQAVGFLTEMTQNNNFITKTAPLEEMSSIKCCYRPWLDAAMITLLRCAMFTSSPLRVLLTCLNIV